MRWRPSHAHYFYAFYFVFYIVEVAWACQVEAKKKKTAAAKQAKANTNRGVKNFSKKKTTVRTAPGQTCGLGISHSALVENTAVLYGGDGRSPTVRGAFVPARAEEEKGSVGGQGQEARDEGQAGHHRQESRVRPTRRLLCIYGVN